MQRLPNHLRQMVANPEDPPLPSRQHLGNLKNNLPRENLQFNRGRLRVMEEEGEEEAAHKDEMAIAMAPTGAPDEIKNPQVVAEVGEGGMARPEGAVAVEEVVVDMTVPGVVTDIATQHHLRNHRLRHPEFLDLQRM